MTICINILFRMPKLKKVPCSNKIRVGKKLIKLFENQMYYLEKRKIMRYFLFNRSIYNRCIALLFSIFSFTVLFAQVSQHGVIKDNNGKLLSGVIITVQESTISAESN